MDVEEQPAAGDGLQCRLEQDAVVAVGAGVTQPSGIPAWSVATAYFQLSDRAQPMIRL